MTIENQGPPPDTGAEPDARGSWAWIVEACIAIDKARAFQEMNEAGDASAGDVAARLIREAERPGTRGLPDALRTKTHVWRTALQKLYPPWARRACTERSAWRQGPGMPDSVRAIRPFWPGPTLPIVVLVEHRRSSRVAFAGRPKLCRARSLFGVTNPSRVLVRKGFSDTS